MENEQKDCSEIEQLLKEKGKVELLGDMLHLKHHPCELALSMIESKQMFVSFLLGLQNITSKDYSLLTVHEDKAKEFFKLFVEWQVHNPIFSNKELRYCPYLRGYAFMRVFIVAKDIPIFEKSFFQFLIAYSMAK